MKKQKNINPIKTSFNIQDNHHTIDSANQFLSFGKKSQLFHALSQSKARSNTIRINKARLPPDFFAKCLSYDKKLPQFKSNLKDAGPYPSFPRTRKVQSVRLQDSPQKVSFFGLFQTQPIQMTDFMGSNKYLPLKRKLQTRQQTKREYQQQKRRFTPGQKMQRKALLDLFPATYDQQTTQIIVSGATARVAKTSPRKEQHRPKDKLMIVSNPQMENQKSQNFKQPSLGTFSPKKSQFRTIQRQKKQKNQLQYTLSQCQTIDLHNMTFFNSKSSCLPPIKKAQIVHIKH